MPRPPGSESLAPNDAAVLSVIAAAGVNALAAVYPAASIPAAVVSVVQGTFSLLLQKSDLDPQGLTREIEEALKQMGLQKNTLQWAVNRASEILLRYGSKPVNRIRARVKDARPEAVWMAQQALDDAKGSDLDPGEGEERRHTLQVLRIYYDVYLHHEKGLAEITADVLAQLSDQMGELKIELRSFAIELVANAELRKAERNCYIPGGPPPPELSLRSITAKYGVVPFYNTQQFKDVYDRIKQAEGPVLLVITGEGGSGKTRLAIELGRRLREEGWRYCFIAANDGDDDFQPLFSHDATPIFAVADYALRIKRRVVKFVSAAAKDGWHGKPFCLALLDRKTPDYVAELEKPTDSDPDGVGQKIPFNPIRVELKGLEEDEARALFGSAVRELARHYDLALPPDIEEKWLLLRKSAHLRPLNVTLGALLAVRGTLDRPLSDEEILSEALKFEVKDRWMAQGMEEDAIPRAMDIEQSEEYEQALKLLAAYVVLRGHTKVSELQQAATELITSSLFPYVGDGNAHQLAILLCKMLHKTGHPRVCIPMEPDPVADFMLNEMRSTWPQRFGQVLERVLDGILNEYAQMHDRGDQERAKATLRTQAEQVLNVLERAFPEGEFLLQVSTDVAQHTGMSGLAMFAGALARKGQDAIKTLHDVLDPPIPDPNAPLLNTLLHSAVFLAKVYAAEGSEERATAYGTVGNIFFALGRHEEAYKVTRITVQLYQRFASRDPARFLPDLAASLNNLAGRLSNLGRHQEALEPSRRAVELYQQLADKNPTLFNPELATGLSNLALVLSALGRHQEALEPSRRAVELHRQLAEQNPTRFLPDLAASLNNLANRLSALGRHQEALEPAQLVAELHRQLADENPTRFLPDLAASLNNLANRLSALGRHQEALEPSRRAVELHRQLADKNPTLFNPELATGLSNLALVLSALGRHQEALEPSRRAVELRQQLAEENPTGFLPELAKSLGLTSHILNESRHHKETFGAAEEALRKLKDHFLQSPRAYARSMMAVLTGYENARRHCGCEPDMELVNPIIEKLREL